MIVQDYISYIKDIRRYSPRTCEIYSAVLKEYFEFSVEGELSDDKALAALSPAHIRNYELHLLDDKKEDPRTVGLHLSVLSSLCKYLVREDLLQSNPVRSIPRPKTPKRLPVFYRDEEMKAYFSSTAFYCDSTSLEEQRAASGKMAIDIYERRLRRMIISLLYGTGIRRSELIALSCGALDFSRKTIRVRGKGDKVRDIPLTDSLCEEILLYLQSVEAMTGLGPDAQRALLLTASGRPLYPVYVDRAVKRELSEAPGFQGRKSPHALRHTLATGLLEDGADLSSIKELLGHSSLAATQVYTHSSVDQLKKVYKSAHPRAKKRGNHGD